LILVSSSYINEITERKKMIIIPFLALLIFIGVYL